LILELPPLLKTRSKDLLKELERPIILHQKF